MSYQEISNSTFLYALVIAGLLIIAGIAVVYLVKCYKHAIACGISKDTIKEIVKSSITFSVVPSISIVAGLISLVAVIGVPYAWFRLSVLGSVVYELLASSMALSAAGVDVTTATGQSFGLVMWVMCFAISLGTVFNIFLCKKVHLGTMKVGGGDPKWKVVSQGIFMNALLIVMITPYLLKGIPTMATLISSSLIGILCSKIAQNPKFRWVGGFGLAFSLIGAMVLSVFFDKMF